MSRKSNLTLRTTATVFEKGKHREMVIEWCPSSGDLITLRAAGLRTRYPIQLSDLYERAVRLTVEAERRQRRMARKGKK